MPTKRTPQAAALAATPLPAIGQPLAGGLYAGITTGRDGAPYALILLADKPAKDLTWKASLTWATKLKADLPTRPEGALLFALLKPQFEERWHWTNESCSWDSSSAWTQYFLYGAQGNTREGYAGRARAVRRLPLQSFNALVAA